jgi:hypothetical protein
LGTGVQLVLKKELKKGIIMISIPIGIWGFRMSYRPAQNPCNKPGSVAKAAVPSASPTLGNGSEQSARISPSTRKYIPAFHLGEQIQLISAANLDALASRAAQVNAPDSVPAGPFAIKMSRIEVVQVNASKASSASSVGSGEYGYDVTLTIQAPDEPMFRDNGWAVRRIDWKAVGSSGEDLTASSSTKGEQTTLRFSGFLGSGNSVSANPTIRLLPCTDPNTLDHVKGEIGVAIVEHSATLCTTVKHGSVATNEQLSMKVLDIGAYPLDVLDGPWTFVDVRIDGAFDQVISLFGLGNEGEGMSIIKEPRAKPEVAPFMRSVFLTRPQKVCAQLAQSSSEKVYQFSLKKPDHLKVDMHKERLEGSWLW